MGKAPVLGDKFLQIIIIIIIIIIIPDASVRKQAYVFYVFSDFKNMNSFTFS